MRRALLAVTALAWLILPALPKSLLSLAAVVWLCAWMRGEWRRTHPDRREVDEALVLLEIEANEERR
jgi:hypothetical protein